MFFSPYTVELSFVGGGGVSLSSCVFCGVFLTLSSLWGFSCQNSDVVKKVIYSASLQSFRD